MIFTFGHSTLDVSEAIEVLAGAPRGISVLFDVRSHPQSRWPQWNHEKLERWVPRRGLKYEWWPDLGGWLEQDEWVKDFMATRGVNIGAYFGKRFPKQQIAADRTGTRGHAWTNQGLYDYAWYTAMPRFHRAAFRLMKEYGDERPPHCAIMCCEVLWWKCHRSMIADWLVGHGSDAWHLQPKLTQHAAVVGDRLLRYPAEVRRAWRNGSLPVAEVSADGTRRTTRKRAGGAA